jgi:UDP-galactopyranose mutase
MSNSLGPEHGRDLICFSHLRWNFVYQRPQHLMTRCAQDRRVFFFEEPEYVRNVRPRLQIRSAGDVTIVVPQLSEECLDTNEEQRLLVDELLQHADIRDFLLWYYTPMALAFTRHLNPTAVVYDCMDDLSAFKNPPTALRALDAELMRRASLVLTGGQSLFEARRHLHHNIYPFPSSVDVNHFAQARLLDTDPPDQARIPKPRLGFFGVIDERMDLALLEGIADARPDWQLVMIGPVVKIDPASLPQSDNIHFLGGKTYAELPHYVAGWNVALLPFARNEATRFISPTKTPEYMAAGKPVVSTSIRDVIRPYGQQGLVRIADDAPGFVRACTAAMSENSVNRERQADAFLRQTSWDGTWSRIRVLLESASRPNPSHAPAEVDAAAV